MFEVRLIREIDHLGMLIDVLFTIEGILADTVSKRQFSLTSLNGAPEITDFVHRCQSQPVTKQICLSNQNLAFTLELESALIEPDRLRSQHVGFGPEMLGIGPNPGMAEMAKSPADDNTNGCCERNCSNACQLEIHSDNLPRSRAASPDTQCVSRSVLVRP